jgi:hypothetical protein
MSTQSLTSKKITTNAEVEECVGMYLELNDESFLESSFEFACMNLYKSIRLGKFARCARDESGALVAWLLADVGVMPHADYEVLQQKYYCSNVVGTKAVRAVRLLHDDMVSYARSKGVNVLISQGSPYDDSNTFTRILEKSGWERKNFLAIKKLAS